MTGIAAIFHHPDAIESDNTPLAGRRAAGQSFLAGFVRHSGADVLRCVAGSDAHVQHFKDVVESFGWTGPVQGTLLRDPHKIGPNNAIMLPGPSLAPYSWVRRRVGEQSYSLVGITHTVSTRRICTGLQDLMSAPVEDWDAIICTSKAVHDVVAEQLNESADFLSRRFGARRMPMPGLPIIPLGIDTERFQHDPAERARLRDQFGVADDDVVIMSMGRLSIYEKMHPAPLMQAVQRAAAQTGRKVVLMMTGWFKGEANESLHRMAAKQLAPDVRVEFPDGKDQDLRFSLWSAADIFALPVDNIQETFGLVPVEAMAAGLPVVCSDWNGFRDTVVHDVTGFRVRTFMANPGHGAALAHRFEDEADSYHQYLGSVHQRTAVDVREMAGALAALIQDPERRKTMGAAGRAHARETYDWATVIPQYQALWAELAARRARGVLTSPTRPGQSSNPSAIDPFRLYRGYPSDHLTPGQKFTAETRLDAKQIDHWVQLSGAQALRRMVNRADAVLAVQQIIFKDGPVDAAYIAQKTGLNIVLMESILLWLLKFDLIQIQD